VDLVRLLARYGPDTADVREIIRKAVAFRIESTWPTDGSRGTGLAHTMAATELGKIENQILQLSPASPSSSSRPSRSRRPCS
jgi:hypothetical protein